MITNVLNSQEAKEMFAHKKQNNYSNIKVEIKIIFRGVAFNRNVIILNTEYI